MVVLPIQQAFEYCKTFSRDSEKAKAIYDKVIKFRLLDNQPFSDVTSTFEATLHSSKLTLLHRCVLRCTLY